jgi:hypothetical protein
MANGAPDHGLNVLRRCTENARLSGDVVGMVEQATVLPIYNGMDTARQV